MDIQLLKKFPLGTKGKKFTIKPTEIIKKQFFLTTGLFILYTLSNLKITKNKPNK